MNSYNHTDIETKWANFWQENQIYKTPAIQVGDPKKYILDMFPYPSAAGLHIGHPRGYTATDILSRFYRMTGHKVLHPMGWDAFGLPAEQHAVKTGVHPKLNTQNNVDNFRQQLKKMGFSYDWNQEVDTTDPNYYKWTQWIFIKLFEKGLAFEQETAVNWCPALSTILANEEIVGGVSERGGHPVFRLPIKQWLLKITEYAQRLNADLEELSQWPKKIKLMQQNWIGQSTGFEVDFALWSPNLNSKLESKSAIQNADKNSTLKAKEVNSDQKNPELSNLNSDSAIDLQNPSVQPSTLADSNQEETKETLNSKESKITVYTTRLDTIFGVTFLVISPEHSILAHITTEEQKVAVENYCQKALAKSDLERTDLNKDKEGVWTGSFAINPINQAKIPIWVADYVLMSYGTGAIMAVPAHDGRDFDFAQKFDLPIVPVIAKQEDSESEKIIKEIAADQNNQKSSVEADLASNSQIKDQIVCFIGEGLTINSGQFSGLEKTEAIAQISQKLTSASQARAKTNYKLRDWIFSRQRFWGEPIPIVFEVNESGQKISGPIAVHESDLPVLLPEIDDFDRIKPDTSKTFPEAALARFPEWFQVRGYLLDGKFKQVKSSETASFNSNLSDSQNYSNKVKTEPSKTQTEIKNFVRETNTMPQWAGSSWYWLRFMDPHNADSFCDMEKAWGPVDIYIGGAEHAVLHLLYARFWHKVLFDLKLVTTKEPFTRLVNQGLILAEDGQKISKSLGNGPSPDEIVNQWGADALRLYQMFLGPFEQAVMWNSSAIVGVYRFLERFWNLQSKITFENLENNQKIDSNLAKNIATVELELHKLIKKITEDIENCKFNTCVSELMKFVNLVEKTGVITFPQILTATKLLAPLAPFICEEIYQNLAQIYKEKAHQSSPIFQPKKSIHLESWPQVGPSQIISKTTIIAISINGKVRGSLDIGPDLDQAGVQLLVLQQDFVQKYLTDGQFKKFIYIPGKIVNLVV